MFCGKASVLLVVIIGTVWFWGAPAEALPTQSTGNNSDPECRPGWRIKAISVNPQTNNWAIHCEQLPTTKCEKIYLGFGFSSDECRTETYSIQPPHGNSDSSSSSPLTNNFGLDQINQFSLRSLSAGNGI